MASRRARIARPRRPRSPKSALRQQLIRALAHLRGKSPLGDGSVHEARKDLKRARATLRLLRGAIGDPAYRRANRRLRDAARPLSRVRDAKVLVDTVAQLRADAANGPRRTELEALEQELRSDRRQARDAVLNGAGVVTGIRRSIRVVRSAIGRWPEPTDDALRRGVERIYRKGRKAFSDAEADRSDATLHESRKQTKYLGKALEVLEPGAGMAARAKRARRAESIADVLGDDHDLAVLEQRLAARAASASAGRAIVTRIERRRKQLQRKAAKQSRRLYRRKPGAFVEALDLGPR
jgi:CHAD domain